ncbi:hypothetical protein L498_3142, partial [Bordetella holmesii CDC-H629-BH]
MTYDALRRGLADKTLPHLSAYSLTRAWTGGVTGEATQQPTLSAPGWATLLSGQWADRHNVRSNATDQAIKTASLFQRVIAAQPQVRSAAALSASPLATLLRRDHDAGYLASLTDCAGQDDCVSSQARDRITEGYDIVLAQFGAPGRAAAAGGLDVSYEAVLRRTDAAVGVLAAQVAARQLAHPGEKWLTLLVSSHGLGKTGTEDGLPLSLNKTIFVAGNLECMLGGSADDAAFDGSWDSNWYALPSAADVTPTVLSHMGALPEPRAYDMAGTSLAEPVAVRRLVTRTATDNKSVTLRWVRVGEPQGDVVISRDGVEIARVAGTTSEYVDSALAFEAEGMHTLIYGSSRNTGECRPDLEEEVLLIAVA